MSLLFVLVLTLAPQAFSTSANTSWYAMNRTNGPAFFEDSDGVVIPVIGAGSGFTFKFAKPANPGWFSLPTVHTDISNKLKNIGLDCTQNTVSKVGQHAADVVGSFQSNGLFEFATKHGSGQKTALGGSFSPPWPTSTNDLIDGAGGMYHDRLHLMMSNLPKLNSIYRVSTVTKTGHYQSTSYTGLKTALTQVGNIIGTLADGQEISRAQIGNIVSNLLKNATAPSVSENDWNYIHDDTYASMIPNKNGNGAMALAGLYTKHHVTIKEYKSKKKTTKQCSYTTENHSVIFADQATFDYVFKKFITSMRRKD